MKKTTSFIIFVSALVAVNLAWIALLSNTPLSLALAQPRFTPAAPEGDVQSVVHQESPSPSVAVASAQSPSTAMRLRSLTADELKAQPAAQVLRQDGLRFPSPSPRVGATELVSPQAPSETCQDMLANSQMDVLENGDGTGTVDSWTILAPIIYYSKVYSHSASYSLKEMDELDGSDPISVTIGGVLWDYDEFGQLFRAPAGLTYLKVSFSSMYRDRDVNDQVYARLWTVNSQNQLDQFISAVRVPTDTSEYTWANWNWELTSAQLIAASNKTLALVFTMFGNRAGPGQGVYFDDAQVRLCYATGPTKIYLPITIKSPPKTDPTCTPYEPDNRDTRGNMTVGATCSGALGPSDDKDYYTLNLNGVTDVKLRLFNLPPEGNVWGAAIYEYPYTGQSPACLINWTGLDKSVDCRGLNLNKTYFVFVAASVAQSSPKSYSMSVTSLYGPTPTPTPTSTPPPSGWTTIVNETFEGSFPGVWQVSDQDGSTGGTYYWGKRDCKAYAGSFSGWAVGGGANGGSLGCGSNYPTSNRSWMNYGPFSLVGATAADLKFKLWLNSETGFYDKLCYMASTDGTSFSGTCGSGNTQGWVDGSLNLASVPTLGNLLGRSSVWIALLWVSDGSVVKPEGAYVDDIVLRKCTSGSCPSVNSSTFEPANSLLQTWDTTLSQR